MAVRPWLSVFPGLLLCVIIGLCAAVADTAQAYAFGYSFGGIVWAILLGALVRTLYSPSATFRHGISFSAKTLLEITVVLLGASINAAVLAKVDARLLLYIGSVVSIALICSYFLCRILGLSQNLSALIACGNSICGNSAIAAVGPIIGANSTEISSAIAFTAVLGFLAVLILPFSISLIGLSHADYGMVAGLTVYAVPQVLAATLPVSALSVQIGTLVKLLRVLMLGPLIFVVSLARQFTTPGTSLSFNRLVPWFIVGFALLATVRYFELVPDFAIRTTNVTATVLAVISMAALGLGVDLKVVGRLGGRIIVAVTLSLTFIAALSIALVRYSPLF